MIPEISDKLKKIPNISRSLLSKSFDENKIKKIRETLDEYLKVWLELIRRAFFSKCVRKRQKSKDSKKSPICVWDTRRADCVCFSCLSYVFFTITIYLIKYITNHEILSSSQDLYTFLCPSPEYVKGNTLKIDNVHRGISGTDRQSFQSRNAEKFSVSSLFGG